MKTAAATAAAATRTKAAASKIHGMSFDVSAVGGTVAFTAEVGASEGAEVGLSEGTGVAVASGFAVGGVGSAWTRKQSNIALLS